MVVPQTTAVCIHILNHIPINNNVNDPHHHQQTANDNANQQSASSSSSTSDAAELANDVSDDRKSLSDVNDAGAAPGRGGDQIIGRRQKQQHGSNNRKGRRRFYNDEHATVYIQYSSSQHYDQSLLTKDGSIFGLYHRILSSEHDINNSNNFSSSTEIRSRENVVDGCSIKEEDDDDGACMLLWAPVILRILPFKRRDDNNNNSSLSFSTSMITNKDDDDAIQIPNLYIPPCLASTLGFHFFHDNTQQHNTVSNSSINTAYLQPLTKNEIVKASYATIREIGRIPPLPNLICLTNIVVNGANKEETDSLNHGENDNEQVASIMKEEEVALRKFFLYPPSSNNEEQTNNEQHIHPKYRTNNKERRSKPRQRLLTLGSIFAVPSHVVDNHHTTISNNNKLLMGDYEEVDDDGCDVQNVRYYQVVNIQSSSTTVVCKEQQKKAYIVSPMTNLTLLPPFSYNANDDNDNGSNLGYNILHPQLDGLLMNGYTWRIPRHSLVTSFLQSIVVAANDGIVSSKSNNDLSTVGDNTTTITRSPPNVSSINSFQTLHPSTNHLVDALYLQGVIPVHSSSSSLDSSSSSSKTCHVCKSSIQHTTQQQVLQISEENYSNNPRIIHVIGQEENYIDACVNEAADIMGMRTFHVNGLAAFWAHYNLFNTYSTTSSKQIVSTSSSSSKSPPLTGALPDKLRGLSASIQIAQQSAPCILHISGIDLELSPTEGHAADVDARREEERRMLEVIREGTSSYPLGKSSFSSSLLVNNIMMDTTSATDDGRRGHNIVAQNAFLSNSATPRVIIVLSTSNPFPPGPISSSLLQSSIDISAPNDDYARILWDDNVDGTYDSLKPYLLGMSARDIRYLREKFEPLWKELTASSSSSNYLDTKHPDDAPSSPVDILQSLLPNLESIRSFTQSSGTGGSSSSTLPLSSSSLPDVRWEDIGGLESIRKEIMDAVELPLKYPELFKGSRRSGILLFGPPGTGKTLVAKAVARECGLPFLSIKGPELLGSYVGESEANIRAVFEAARSAAMDSPTSSIMKDGMMIDKNGTTSSSGYGGASVLFFDELDSLAPRRGETGHGDGVMDRVVATLLSELDGGSSSGSNGKDRSATSANVIVIGATNRPDLLDPSLLRPGRFDRLLYLGPAKSKEHCLMILLAQTRKFNFEEGLDAATVLGQAMESFPPTLSGADLSAVASGALMRGLKRVCKRIEEEVRSINLEKGVGNDSELAVDIDDMMESWSKEQLQPMMTVNDFVEAAKEIVPSISSQDLENFERLQTQFSSGQY